jgi:hypothetical protein
MKIEVIEFSEQKSSVWAEKAFLNTNLLSSSTFTYRARTILDGFAYTMRTTSTFITPFDFIEQLKTIAEASHTRSS